MLCDINEGVMQAKLVFIEEDNVAEYENLHYDTCMTIHGVEKILVCDVTNWNEDVMSDKSDN